MMIFGGMRALGAIFITTHKSQPMMPLPTGNAAAKPSQPLCWILLLLVASYINVCQKMEWQQNKRS